MEEDPLIEEIVAERYRVKRKLGEGGMCAVYEAEHVKLKKPFAVKRLIPQLAHNEEAVQRFELEAEMLAGLRHPNVVEISGWEICPDGSPAMILEFLHGAHLGVRLQRGAMKWDAIARIGDQAMAAVSLAHRNGITHRDLKPENIFIAIDDAGDERVKLLDFGVSKLGSLRRTTGTHGLYGTPAYMAPEQARGETHLIGPRSDVWAMGTLLYEMATQRSPFKGDSIPETLEKIHEGTYDPMLAFRNDAPQEFVDLVTGALTVDIEQRTQTIDELRAKLRAALEPRNPYRLNTPVAGSPTVRRETQRTPMPPIMPLATSGATRVASGGGRWWLVIAFVVAAIGLVIAIALVQ